MTSRRENERGLQSRMGKGTKVTVDGEGQSVKEPTKLDLLVAVIEVLFPNRKQVRAAAWSNPRRLVCLGTAQELTEDDLSAAISGLVHPQAARHVDAEVIAGLLQAVERLAYRSVDIDPFRSAIIAHTEGRWSELRDGLIELSMRPYQRSAILSWFPRIKQEPALITRLAVILAKGGHHFPSLDEALATFAPSTLTEARLLIEALAQRKRTDGNADSLAAPLFASIGRGLGWAPWTLLQIILRIRPDYADPHATFRHYDDRNRESQTVIDAWHQLASHIEPHNKVREVAGILLELIGEGAAWNNDGLLGRPAEVRAAYVETLKEAIGDDTSLRQAVIEALLWSADGRTADLAQFAAVALARAEDSSMLTELERHPARVVQYAARAVRAAVFGERLNIPLLPSAGGLIQSLVSLDGSLVSPEETARTWLGDRAVESLIERTIAREEARFAQEYVDHGDEGEDRLLASLFAALALRFRDLDQALEGIARATLAPYRAAVAMRYRNVDRAEEGAGGINGVESFSADLCLIVDPILDGTSLGKRVTLIQAKRLYRNHAAEVQPAWNASFMIKPKQVDALLKQTHSSAYLFQGPPLGGRGIPVIPTQLVADLSRRQSSGGALSRTMVATASRSLADWLTYDVLALRTGDPLSNLVSRAEGRAGSLPRSLLRLPRVEVDLAISARSGPG